MCKPRITSRNIRIRRVCFMHIRELGMDMHEEDVVAKHESRQSCPYDPNSKWEAVPNAREQTS